MAEEKAGEGVEFSGYLTKRSMCRICALGTAVLLPAAASQPQAVAGVCVLLSCDAMRVS
jgi:hypothetical protein